MWNEELRKALMSKRQQIDESLAALDTVEKLYYRLEKAVAKKPNTLSGAVLEIVQNSNSISADGVMARLKGIGFPKPNRGSIVAELSRGLRQGVYRRLTKGVYSPIQ